MTTDTLLDIALGIALLCWIGYRQLTWTAVAPERMWRMPAILAIIGVVSLFPNGGVGRVTTGELGILAVEATVSIGLGVAMGMLARFRPISERNLARFTARSGGRATTAPTRENRTGWLGMALWLVLIAARICGEFYAHMTGSALLMSVGVILLTIALNRATRILVITQRAARIPSSVGAPAPVAA